MVKDEFINKMESAVENGTEINISMGFGLNSIDVRFVPDDAFVVDDQLCLTFGESVYNIDVREIIWDDVEECYICGTGKDVCFVS